MTPRRVIIYNRANIDLRLMIEPVGESYDVAPGLAVELSGAFDLDEGILELEHWGDNTISVFAPAETIVTSRNSRLRPI
jgi:hypothetical protein